MSAPRAFVDTNVLLYVFSHGDPRKQTLARQLLQQYASDGELFLSTQVVQEFYAAGLRKMALPRPLLREAVAQLLSLPTVTLTPAHIVAAIELEEQHRISIWDALILAAADSCCARFLFTEDLNDGQRYGSVVVRNPFAWLLVPPHYLGSAAVIALATCSASAW